MDDTINILIAEDNRLNQKIISIMIERLGWNYFMVDNGQKAVDECISKDYDVVLMDIDMPVMNGWDATIEIKKIKPDLPVIALTAYSEEIFRQRSFDVGMNYFLAKPYNLNEIERTILKSLEKE
ncbi:MAG: response regulator [Lentimicrobiaceae bacterium]